MGSVKKVASKENALTEAWEAAKVAWDEVANKALEEALEADKKKKAKKEAEAVLEDNGGSVLRKGV